MTKFICWNDGRANNACEIWNKSLLLRVGIRLFVFFFFINCSNLELKFCRECVIFSDKATSLPRSKDSTFHLRPRHAQVDDHNRAGELNFYFSSSIQAYKVHILRR